MQSVFRQIWRSPEEIVEIGFQRSSVVMMNEAHAGSKRCIRTRQIGQRILPIAHQAGVRHLAMEALFPAFAEQSNNTRRVSYIADSYLSQLEMRDFIQTALDFGWTLIAYEANPFKWLSARYGINFPNAGYTVESINSLQQYQTDMMSMEFTNWREEQQALNLIQTVQSLPTGTSMLVWCGNSHLAKEATREWIPMGYQFKTHSNINPFVIDQTRTVKFNSRDSWWSRRVRKFAHDQLEERGGTAGFLIEEAPSLFKNDDSVDAILLSNQNELE